MDVCRRGRTAGDEFDEDRLLLTSRPLQWMDSFAKNVR